MIIAQNEAMVSIKITWSVHREDMVFRLLLRVCVRVKANLVSTLIEVNNACHKCVK